MGLLAVGCSSLLFPALAVILTAYRRHYGNHYHPRAYPAPTLSRAGSLWSWMELGRRLPALLLSLRPPDGWVAAGLLTLNMIIVVWSVEEADWAPTPSLWFW